MHSTRSNTRRGCLPALLYALSAWFGLIVLAPVYGVSAQTTDCPCTTAQITTCVMDGCGTELCPWLDPPTLTEYVDQCAFPDLENCAGGSRACYWYGVYLCWMNNFSMSPLSCADLIAAIRASLVDPEPDMTACEAKCLMAMSGCSSVGGICLEIEGIKRIEVTCGDKGCEALHDFIEASLLCNGVVCGLGMCTGDDPGDTTESPTVTPPDALAELVVRLACVWLAECDGENAMSCVEIIQCLVDIIAECKDDELGQGLPPALVARVLSCSGCSFDCEALEFNCEGDMPCPGSDGPGVSCIGEGDLDGDGDCDADDAFLGFIAWRECCEGGTLTDEEVDDILCEYIDRCNLAAGTMSPAGATGPPHAPSSSSNNWGIGRAFNALQRNWVAQLRELFGDEFWCEDCYQTLDGLTDCEKMGAPGRKPNDSSGGPDGDGGGGDDGSCEDPQSSETEHPTGPSPVQLASGHKLEGATDLIVPLPGRDFRLTRAYTSSEGYTGASLVGNNWTLSAFQFLRTEGSGGSLKYILDGPSLRRVVPFSYSSATLFLPNGSSTLQVIAPSSPETVVIDSVTYDLVELTEPGSWTKKFFDPEDPDADDFAGLLYQESDVYGNTSTYDYDVHTYSAVNYVRLRNIFLNGTDHDTADAVMTFWWYTGGVTDADLSGKLSFVELLRHDVNGDLQLTEQVTYFYQYDGSGFSGDVGTAGDLIMVVHETLVDQAPGATAPLRRTITQYRYHDDTSAPTTGDERLQIAGELHQLKMVINPEQLEFAAQRMQHEGTPKPVSLAAADWAWDLLSLDDDYALYTGVQVMDLAAKIVDYDGGVVSQQYIQAGCGCSGAAQGIRLDYLYYGWTDGSGDGRTAHIAESKLVSSTYVLNRDIYYDMREYGAANVPYLVTRAIVEAESPNRVWVTAKEYTNDDDRNLAFVMTPSACSSYTPVAPGGPPTAPSYTASTSTGLVWAYVYEDNRRTETRVREGYDADPGEYDLVTKVEYRSDARPWLVAQVERFRTSTTTDGVDAADVETQTFTYGFFSGTPAAHEWVKIEVEAETEAENGPDGTYTTYDVFDAQGQSVWTLAADNVLTYRDHDPATGALIAVVRDAASTNAGGIADADLAGTLSGSESTSGWGSGSPDELVSRYTVDMLGRESSSETSGGVKSYTIRRLRPLSTLTGIHYYSEMRLPHDLGALSVPRFDGPATAIWFNAAGRVLASTEYRIDAAASYDPAALNYSPIMSSVSGFGELALSTTTYTLNGLRASQQAYHDAEGEFFTNPLTPEERYHETTFAYDELGRMKQTVAANGTITEYEYDVLNRVIKLQIGKGDGMGDNAVQPVAEYFYDDPDVGDGPDQGVGNGNLNFIVSHVTDSTTRETMRHFDYRDRLYKVINPTKPYEFMVYDNLDRVTERGVFKEEPVAIDDPLAHRGLYSTTAYSQRGLVYRQQVATDATESSPSFLESHSWYDAVGRPIQRWDPNAPATKTQYDAHGRPKLVATIAFGSDGSPGDPGSHAGADDLVDDFVFEQVNYAYTSAGRVDTVLTYQHWHDESTSGELDATIAIRTFVGYIYDDAQRPIRTLNYGTNDDSADIFKNDTLPTWPLGGVPDDWGSLPTGDPIMTGVVYNDRGLVEDSVDPKGRITRTFYDDLNRRIAVVENFEDATLTWDPGTPLVDSPRWVALGLDTNEPDKDRVTSFIYDGAGNVVQQMAQLPSDADPVFQVTSYEYGTTAPSTPVAMDSLIASGDLLAAVHYPDESDGEANPDAAHTVAYAYNRLGELIAVTDQNGTLHEYARDDAGRVLIDSVEDFGTDIDDAVQSLEVRYDDFGRMDQALSWSGTDASGDTLNTVKFTYTTLWQVKEVFQDTDSDIDTGTPIGLETRKVMYIYQPGSNSSMPAYQFYPSNATLSMSYNDGGFRPNSLDISGGVQLAAYTYLGMSTFAITDYVTPDVQLDRTMSTDGARNGFGIVTQDLGVYPGLDRFGRVKFHVWASGDTDDGGALPTRAFLASEAYSYDAASNRTVKDTVQPVLGQNWNHIDWNYEYDGLDRLIEAHRGTWTGTMSPQPGSQSWTLDTLGNWSQFMHDLDGDGTYADADELESRAHNVANEITLRDPSGTNTPAVSGLPFAYDDAGNMTSQELRPEHGDGTRSYVHDAWNRLVEVRLDHDNTGGDPAFSIAKYEYNPLHWRTVKIADVRGASTDPDTGPELTQRRAMYYDASWRLIEEHICDDWVVGVGGDVNRIGQNFWGGRYIDDLIYRREDRDITNAPYPAEDPEEPDWDEGETPGWFALTDVQFSVVALITPTAKLVERVVYDPYGRGKHYFATDYNGDGVTSGSDSSAASAAATTGTDLAADWDRNGTVEFPEDYDAFDADYQSMDGFVVESGQISWRYDPNDADTFLAPDNQIGYCGYVFNPETDDYTVRFRHYDPEIGRWLEKDPLEYVDGMQPYSYCRQSPIAWSDPTGLYIDDDALYWRSREGREELKRLKEELAKRRHAPRTVTPDPAAAERCRQWAERESKRDWLDKLWWVTLLDCPCEIDVKRPSDPRYTCDTDSGHWEPIEVRGQGLETWEPYHPNAEYQLRSKPQADGSGQQCTYDKNGKLITGGPSAGTADRVAPDYYFILLVARWVKNGIVGAFTGGEYPIGPEDFLPDAVQRHRKEDVFPFADCRDAGMLDVYFMYRPPSGGKDSKGKPCSKNVVD